MQFAKRVDRFGAGIFSKLLEIKNEKLEQDDQVIDLGIGAPNIPPTEHIRQVPCKAAAKPENYVYAASDRTELPEAVAKWYQKRHDVKLGARAEICSLLGSQEGLAHIAMTVVGQGDVVLVPGPCYPVFGGGPLLAGAELYCMPQRQENGYIIQLSEIPEDVARRAKFMVVSYPNNPTMVMAPDSFYEELIAFAKKYETIMLHDNAYSELVFDRKTCGNFPHFPGMKDAGVEFSSLSKTYGLAGAGIGSRVGNAQAVAQLKDLKSNMDYEVFLPIQQAAITAITGDQEYVAVIRRAYERRRGVLCNGLKKIGWEMEKPEATMFVWARIPDHCEKSKDFTMDLVGRAGILVAPGGAFGPSGEGHVRLTLIRDEEELNRAVEAIRQSDILEDGQRV